MRGSCAGPGEPVVVWEMGDDAVTFDKKAIAWKWYSRLIKALSLLHYGVLSRFSPSDEGGLAWYRRRTKPSLPDPPPGPRIWIHAVSAGEAKVATLLVPALVRAGVKPPVLISTTTSSGYERIWRWDGEYARTFVMPVDTIQEQRRLFDGLKPTLLVLIESEFWPAQFAMAREFGVPIVVVNATLSDRSVRRHRLMPLVTKVTIRRALRIFPQDERTAERYRELNVYADRIEVLGNLKLAGAGLFDGDEGGRSWVTFGNLHRAELQRLAPAIREIARDAPVLLVPRYPKKLAPELLRRLFGDELQIVDHLPEAVGPGQIVWVDSMGILADAYLRSVVGVVCGTFAPIGGHDLSEPLQQGAAAVYGPHVERQHALDVALRGADAATAVTDAAQLPAAVRALIADPVQRAERRERFAELVHDMERRLGQLAVTLKDLSEREKR